MHMPYALLLRRFGLALDLVSDLLQTLGNRHIKRAREKTNEVSNDSFNFRPSPSR